MYNSVNYCQSIHQTCVGSGVSYNHGTFDIDGDSLVFSAIPSKGNATSDIVYAAGLSVSDPIQELQLLMILVTMAFVAHMILS